MNKENDQMNEETTTNGTVSGSNQANVTHSAKKRTKKVAAEFEGDLERRCVVIEAKIGLNEQPRKDRDQTVANLGIKAIEFALDKMAVETGNRLPDAAEFDAWLESKLKG